MDESSIASLSRTRLATDAAESDRPQKKLRGDPAPPRVSRACDRCKSRKTRCSGTWPCVFCAEFRLDCQFTAAYRRGQLLPAIDNNAVNVERQNSSEGANSTPAEKTAGGEHSSTSVHQNSFVGTIPRSLTTTSRTAIESPNTFQFPPLFRDGEITDFPRRSVAVDHLSRLPDTNSLRNSPEPPQTDEQGHYIGPASGVSFLSRIQKRLKVQSSGYLNSSVFNFGDRPLLGQDSSFAILPPKTVAVSMVRRYFDFGATTHRFLHRPTIQSWLEELYETNGFMLYKESARSQTALLFMVFAHSNSYQSRQLNHCWTLFGITAQLAMALGIHRRSRVARNPSDCPDYIDSECRKRTFWCAYSLNTYLSAALGRPMTFHDEDIDQKLPLSVVDDKLCPGCGMNSTESGLPITSAPVAQIKLSRIVARVLRSLYGIKSISTEEHLTLAARFDEDLSEWREPISYLLDTVGSSTLFVKLVLRQRDLLQLAFWHAQILVHRPLLINSINSFSGHVQENGSGRLRYEEIRKNIQRCVDAATEIAKHINHINDAGELYSTLFFIPYYGFCAVVILYVFAIQRRTEAPETYLDCFRLASQCHAQIESVATNGSLMQRYGVVLQELRLEVLRNNTYLASVSTPLAGNCSTSNENNEILPVSYRRSQLSPEIGTSGSRLAVEQAAEGAPQGAIDFFHAFDVGFFNMTNWAQFDSLVTGGTGNLDAFVHDDSADLWDQGSDVRLNP
ncbi:finger protein [Colletotrichum scovillei]|uniref:Finger protein n=1 Tax=Colletotrichum scovillei TaxID=1209932 RepID=A0A9P7ULL5_9PEZI|nr:finger protein [Colletotrichum scovillei]KAG7082355.1 finger protein [Colletotrichum scovillei]